MQQKNSGATIPVTRFRMLDLDDIIARDDAAELADFMGRSLCSSSVSHSGRNAIVRFRNHTIEIDMHEALAIRIDSVGLDTPSHPALTDLLLSLMSAVQPIPPIAPAS